MEMSPGIVNDCVTIVSLYYNTPIEDIPRKSSQLFTCNNIENSLRFLEYIKLIDKGVWSRIILSETKEDIYKEILRLYILKRKVLRNRIKYGIGDLIDNLSANEKASFMDAKLVNYNDVDVALWWLKLSKTLDDDETKKIIDGYLGERLSIEYESKILNIDKEKIQHTSLRGADAGYDILSYNKKNKKSKPIEVKTISSLRYPFIYITSNEFKKSKLPNYVFHIWVIENNINNLYVFNRDDFINDWPILQGDGVLTGPIKIDLTLRLTSPIFSSESS